MREVTGSFWKDQSTKIPPTDLVDPDPAVGAVVHGVVVDVDVVAGPGHLQYSTVQYSTVQYGTVWYSTVQYSLISIFMSLYCTML